MRRRKDHQRGAADRGEAALTCEHGEVNPALSRFRTFLLGFVGGISRKGCECGLSCF
jgi:hypothetical protein